MKNSIIIRVVFFGAFAIMGIIAIQVYLLKNTWDAAEKEFNENVTIALMNVAKEFEKLGGTLPAYDLVKQVSSNYFVVDINNVIDANNLEYFLRREFERVGIRSDFEYGIYNCDTRKMAYGKYISYNESEKGEALHPKEQLPVYDKFLYYFGVRFPNRTTQVLSAMRLSIVFSVILLFTILFFLYSMFIILRQKRLSEMQKDFINNMTHEFKTPISTIKVSSEVFMNAPEVTANKRLKQYAQIIRDQNDRLNEQVEKVLQLARIEKNTFSLQLEKLDMADVLRTVLEGTRIQIEKSGGTLIADIPDTKVCVQADRLHLTNILHSLLDNAMKYCKDSPKMKVTLKEEAGNKARLIIEDEGIGIEPQHLKKIFEKFYRVPTGNVHNVKGFGLGLFYVKNVCRSHGWKIHIDSEPGKGTTVEMLFPTLPENSK
ncbi:MAG: two-component sensor histidine kinase [Saprospirales bacterium]|nr:two-component sensor histidine kinase [Saprospirales bacterium]